VARSIVDRSAPRLAENLPNALSRLEGDVDVTEMVLSGDFSSCRLTEPMFTECLFDRAAFTGATLRFARFVDCVVIDSDLSGAMFEECSLTRVEFRSCRASGLQAARGRFADVGLFASKLDGANFRMSEWQHAEITDCDLSESDFYEAKMPSSRIIGCDLSGAELSRSQLAGTHLGGSNLADIRGGESLRRVTISSDQIIPAAMAVFKAQRITVDDNLDGDGRS
jgi:uncharacterized protein YjbI with pentapeptide repeats